MTQTKLVIWGWGELAKSMTLETTVQEILTKILSLSSSGYGNEDLFPGNSDIFSP